MLARHPQDARVRGPKGTVCEVFTAQTPISIRTSRSQASGRSSSAIWHSSSDPKKYADFYCRVLGFRVSDWIEDWFVFLRCGPDHHTVNFVRGKRTHDAPRRLRAEGLGADPAACDFLGLNKIPLIWGPGRHGPGHNIYTYHRNPDDQIIEMFTELDKMLDEVARLFRSAAVASRPSAEAEGVVVADRPLGAAANARLSPAARITRVQGYARTCAG